MARQMLETTAQVRDWLQRADERHRFAGPHECSCGWFGPKMKGAERMRFEEHATIAVRSDLGDVVASDCSDSDGPLSWREYADWLNRCNDQCLEESESFLSALFDIACGAEDPPDRACAEILAAYPPESYPTGIGARLLARLSELTEEA